MRIDTCGRASDEHYTRRCNGSHMQPATARGRPMYKRPSETADSDFMGSSANTGTLHCQGESRRSKRPPSRTNSTCCWAGCPAQGPSRQLYQESYPLARVLWRYYATQP